MKVSITDLREHVERLVEENQIAIVGWVKRPTRAYSCTEGSEIWIAPIRSRVSYATAMHEIGHILGKHQSSKDVMVRERHAWRWAKKHARVWTDAMERNVEKSLAWYAARRARLNAKWRPPVYEIMSLGWDDPLPNRHG